MYNQIVNNNFLKGRKIMSSINLAFGFPKEAEKAKAERWPVLIPVGTMEYHSEHCAYGCDSLVSIGLVERLAQKIDAVVMPPIWYGVASYAVAGPEQNTIDVDADAFEAFTETGDIFNEEVADKFRRYVLTPGGIDDGMTMYQNFRGRAPKIDALLKNRGL